MEYNSVVVQFRYPGSDRFYTKVYSLSEKEEADEVYHLVVNHRDYDDIQGYCLCERASRRDYYVRKCGGPYEEQASSGNSDDSDDSDFSESEDDGSVEIDGSENESDDGDDVSMGDSSASNDQESDDSNDDESDAVGVDTTNLSEEDSECESGSGIDLEEESDYEKKPPPQKKRKVSNERKKVVTRLVDSEDESGSDPDMPDLTERKPPTKSRADSHQSKVTSGRKSKRTVGKVKEAKAGFLKTDYTGTTSKESVGKAKDVVPLKSDYSNQSKVTSGRESKRTIGKVKEAKAASLKTDYTGSTSKEGVGKAKDVVPLKSDDIENGKKEKKESPMELNSAYDDDDDEKCVDLSALAGEYYFPTIEVFLTCH